MEPGIYTDVSREDYDAIVAINNSRLSAGTKSLATLRAELDSGGTRETSEAMEFGAAYHCLVLEPDRFDHEYAMSPEGKNADGSASASSKDGKTAWAVWEDQNEGKAPISPRDWRKMFAMRDAIMQHPAAKSLLSLPADNEVTVVWDDRDTGELCKCRIDRLARDRATLIDLKSTEDASPSGFERSLLKYGYHRQAAFYADGVHTLTQLQYPGFYLIAQEKIKPYLVGVYLVDDAAIDYGRYQYGKLLAAYSEAMLTNEWPGYSTKVQIIGLPPWFASKARQEMEVHDATF